MTALILAVGAFGTFQFSVGNGGFMAPWPRLAAVALLALGVVAFALHRPRAAATERPGRLEPAGRPERAGRAPSALVVGLVALIATSAPHVLIWSLDLVTPWGVAAALLVVITGSMIGLHRWSTGSGWAPAHTAAAGCGALLTYVWRGFLQPPLIETSRGIDVSSDVVFGAIGIALVAWVARSVGVRARPEPRARART